jgi:hypothetical protein
LGDWRRGLLIEVSIEGGANIAMHFPSAVANLKMTEAALRMAGAAMQQDGALEFLSFGIPFVMKWRCGSEQASSSGISRVNDNPWFVSHTNEKRCISHLTVTKPARASVSPAQSLVVEVPSSSYSHVQHFESMRIAQPTGPILGQSSAMVSWFFQ